MKPLTSASIGMLLTMIAIEVCIPTVPDWGKMIIVCLNSLAFFDFEKTDENEYTRVLVRGVHKRLEEIEILLGGKVS